MEMKPLVEQAVPSYRVNSAAFPQRQSETIIAHMQNYYNITTYHKMRTKCHIHSPPLMGEYCLHSAQVTR